MSSLKPIMVLGTTSGSGKSLMSAAICRYLKRNGEIAIPFKGQNMSNNSWVDKNGGEMAYSQALQAWAAELEPSSSMNPVLIKPKGDSTSEVIHLGESVGFAQASTYYEEWFKPGWSAIQQGLKNLTKQYQGGRLVLEGAGSPVEVNLQHRDLTNLRLAKFIQANCLLVADIERGGVFAQLVGTLALLNPMERKLIKGLLINRFRGDLSLFNEGRKWLEENTGIPVLGVMPWIKEIYPAEDSLDLIERSQKKTSQEIEVVVIRLGSISNFSDLDPLEYEPTVQIRWIEPGESIGSPDVIIIPGSKQTIKDLDKLNSSGLGKQIKKFAEAGGNVFGICGGLQMMGETLQDPQGLENSVNSKNDETIQGLKLLPIKTFFCPDKRLRQTHAIAYWPKETCLSGYELHHGISEALNLSKTEVKCLCNDPSLGWYINNEDNQVVAGTYLHGIFDNGEWRRLWLNQIRRRKNLPELELSKGNYSLERERLLNILTDVFQNHVDLSAIIE